MSRNLEKRKISAHDTERLVSFFRSYVTGESLWSSWLDSFWTVGINSNGWVRFIEHVPMESHPREPDLPRGLFMKAIDTNAASVVIIKIVKELKSSELDVFIMNRFAPISYLLGVELRDFILVNEVGYSSQKHSGS